MRPPVERSAPGNLNDDGEGPAPGEGLRRDLRASMTDGVLYSLMVGAGETYIPAFALALGLGRIAAGLTSTLPMVIGAALQVLCSGLMPSIRSHRRWVVGCAALQALTFVPLVGAGLAGKASWTLVLVAATWYWACGLATGPAWNTWMGRLVPPVLRATFFARRIRWTHLAVLAALLGAGAILHQAAAHGRALLGFVIIFAAAGMFRVGSAACLALQREPQDMPPLESGLLGLAGRARLPVEARRLVAYMLAVQYATYVAASFFTPYMLDELKLSYRSYVLLLAASYVAKGLVLPAAGRLARRNGPRALLWIGGVGVVPTAALWTFSDAIPYLTALQIFGGAVWACYELATFLLLFEMIPEHSRTGVLTMYNFVNAAALAAGSLTGGALMFWLGSSTSGYAVVFVLSSALRLLTLPLLRGVPAGPRGGSLLAMRTVAVEPSSGSIERPILPTVPELETEE